MILYTNEFVNICIMCIGLNEMHVVARISRSELWFGYDQTFQIERNDFVLW